MLDSLTILNENGNVKQVSKVQQFKEIKQSQPGADRRPIRSSPRPIAIIRSLPVRSPPSVPTPPSDRCHPCHSVQLPPRLITALSDLRRPIATVGATPSNRRHPCRPIQSAPPVAAAVRTSPLPIAVIQSPPHPCRHHLIVVPSNLRPVRSAAVVRSLEENLQNTPLLVMHARDDARQRHATTGKAG